MLGRPVEDAVQEAPVAGAPGLVPTVMGGAWPSRGEDEVGVPRRKLAQVAGLDVLLEHREPGVGRPHPSREAIEKAPEAADCLVRDPVVHVDEAESEGLHKLEAL